MVVFFFKQKTAYEMRISDWSSDVCSSDLEVYHRVKNNLQVVSSLVNLQVSRAANEHERGALRATQDRIHALSMVHSNLYKAPELHRIKLQEFVPQLCEYLRQAQGAPSEHVRMEFDIDPVQSEPERAVPLALHRKSVV